MKIAIRKNEIFLESDWQEHFLDGRYDLTKPPYNYQIINLDTFKNIDYEKLEYTDFDYIDGQYILNIERYKEKFNIDKQKEYESMAEKLIRMRYTVSQELAILRQRDSKPEEFAEYNAFCESCKTEAKLSLTE